MSLNKVQKQSGFTIVELLIVIVIIAILAAISIFGYNGFINRGKTSASAQTVSQVSKKAESYNAVQGAYPTHPEFVGTSGPQEARLDTPANVVLYSTTAGNAGVTTVAANYSDGTKVIYRQLSAAGACLFGWDYGAGARTVTTLGTATSATCTA